MTLRVGFLGTGSMGLSHVQLVRDEFPDIDIAAVCDTHGPNLAQAMEAAPKAKVFENPAALIAADLDAVIISTPGSTHADFTEQCLAAGKHVFAEKPAMTTRDGCRRMLDAANKHPTKAVVIDHELRYSKYFQ